MPLEAHLLMIEKIPDRFNKLLVCEEEISDADIPPLCLYSALILDLEHGFYAPPELVFRNDMIQDQCQMCLRQSTIHSILPIFDVIFAIGMRIIRKSCSLKTKNFKGR